MAGPHGALDFKVAHGDDGQSSTKNGSSASSTTACFILVRDAGTGEADGVYKPSQRRWLDHDVYENRYGECIISREAQKSQKNGETKHGFVLGKGGRPLYGAKTEKFVIPTKNWKALQGQEPVPQISTFKTWSDACQHGAWYFMEEAKNAAKGGHWKVSLLMADRAFDCHTTARPKGRGDTRQGGNEWSSQLCELLGMRADALLRLEEYERALLDACAAVHFVPAFEWCKARTRGITACLNLGVSEDQAKLLLDDMSKRSELDFQGLKALKVVLDVALQSAKNGSLKPVVLEAPKSDDERIYYRVLDPEECKLYSGPDFRTRVLGRRQFHEVLRGQQVVKEGRWLELHVSEAHDDSMGHRKAFVPILFLDEEIEEDIEVLEKIDVSEYPRLPIWEQLGLKLKPIGIKPPSERFSPPDYSRWKDPPKPANQRDWPFIYKHKLALAAMVRGATDYVIDSFVRFHWITGWNRVYLFFNDPNDQGIQHARKLEEFCLAKKDEGITISVEVMDPEWWESAKKKSRFFQRRDKNDTFGNICRALEAKNDWICQQLVACDMALLDAHDRGVDWFAHLEVDELVYVPKLLDNSARRFLGSRDRGLESVRLWNFEAVPEALQCNDWFREHTLFQVNPYHCHGFKPPREYDQLLRRKEGRELERGADDAAADKKWWLDLLSPMQERRQATLRRLDLGLKPPKDKDASSPGLLALKTGGAIAKKMTTTTMATANKKAKEDEEDEEENSEARRAENEDEDNDEGSESPLSRSAKTKATAAATATKEAFLSFSGYTCGKCIVHLEPSMMPPLPFGLYGFLSDSGEMLKTEQARNGGDPVVLRYPHASFSSWRDSYENPDFANSDGSDIAGMPPPARTHLASREVVLKRQRNMQELFYKTCIMQSEHNELAWMAEHGVVIRIEGVKEILELYDKPPAEAEPLPGQVELRDMNSGLKFGR